MIKRKQKSNNQQKLIKKEPLEKEEQKIFIVLIKRESILLSTWDKVKITIIQSPHQEALMVIKQPQQNKIKQIINISHSRLSNNYSKVDGKNCFGIIIPSKKKYLLSGKSPQETISIYSHISKIKNNIKNSQKSSQSRNTLKQYPKEVIQHNRNETYSKSAKYNSNPQLSSLASQSFEKSEGINNNLTTATRIEREADEEQSFYTAIQQKLEEYQEDHEQKIIKNENIIRYHQKQAHFKSKFQKQFIKQSVSSQKSEQGLRYFEQNYSKKNLRKCESAKNLRKTTLQIKQFITFQQIRCLQSDQGFKLLQNFTKGRILIKQQKMIKASLILITELNAKKIIQLVFRLELWNQKVKSYNIVNRIDRGIYLVKLQLHKRNFLSLNRYCYMMVYTHKIRDDYAIMFRSLQQSHFDKQFGFSWIRMNLWARVQIKSKTNQKILNICGRFQDLKDYEEGIFLFDEIKSYQTFLETTGQLSKNILQWNEIQSQEQSI